MHTAEWWRETYLSKMYNGLEVITQRLGYSEQQYRSFEKPQEAPEQAECKKLCFSCALRVLSGAPQPF